VRALANTLAEERLISSDADGRTRPRLLESWTESNDGLTWHLVLQPRLRYQDGSPLAPSDIKACIDDARAVPPAQSVSVCVPDITGVSVAGERELVVTLRRRCSYLLEDFDSTITKPSATGSRPIGTGPFTAVERAGAAGRPPGSGATVNEIDLEANRNYYLGAPQIARVVVRAYDTLRTAWAEMMRGRVDFLWEVGPDAAEFLRDQSSVQVRSFPSYYVYALMLNSARAPFADPAVRRALNIGVDRAALVQEALKGQGRPADGPVSPAYWAHDDSVPPLPYDPAAAVGLLAAARRPRVTFTCLLPANFTIYERIALHVQRQLRAINVEMRLEALTPDAYNRRIVAGDFDALLMNMVGGPYQTIQYRFWHSPLVSQRWNYWGYRDPAVDRALEAVRDAGSEAGTRAALKSLTAAFRENPPAVLLAWSVTVQAVSRRFDVPQAADGRDALHLLSRWQLRPPGGRQP